MLNKNKLELLKKLSIEHPNAYVQVGETFYPTRSEFFDFELFRTAAKHDVYRKHNDLPIILTLEESQKVFYERFQEYLYLGTPLKIERDCDQQLAWIFFLKSICNNEEVRKLLDVSSAPTSMIYFIELETWKRLMEYALDPLFVTPYERVEICASIHQGYFFDSGGRNRKLARNEYALRINRLKEQDLEEQAPLLAKALKFYRVTLEDLQKEYKWVKYGSGSGGPN